VSEVLRVVEQLAREGMTLILVTHETRFARDVGTKLVFMHHGKCMRKAFRRKYPLRHERRNCSSSWARSAERGREPINLPSGRLVRSAMRR
jgi:ABC-type polar amino acid transport system ATPase subunit